MPKKSRLSTNSITIKNSIVKTLGIPFVAVIWEYGDSAISYVSQKATKFIHNTESISNNVAYWFTPQKLMGVALASQIFIKACGNHSPAMNFFEKSVIGFEYYTATVATGTFVEFIVSSTKFVDKQINNYISVVSGAIGGVFFGGLVQAYSEKPLDKMCGAIDGIVGTTIIAAKDVVGSVIGYPSNDHCE